MTEYVVTFRFRTDAEPRDDTDWRLVTEAFTKAVFKSRPVHPVEVLGARVEQVVPMVQEKV